MNLQSFDWGCGRYEHTAAQLLPAAQLTVDRAAPLAAARGADVVGVDPAPRLLEVARARAAEQQVEATFVQGDAAGLPVADASADVVVRSSRSSSRPTRKLQQQSSLASSALAAGSC